MFNKKIFFKLILSLLFLNQSQAQSLQSQLLASQKIVSTVSEYLKKHRSNDLIVGTRKMLFLDESYVPQGLFVSDNFYFVSMYHKTADGVVESKPSIVVQYTLTGDFVNKLNLSLNESTIFTGHVGGLGMIGDFYVVPVDKEIYFFNSSTGLFSKKIKLNFENLEDQIKSIDYINISKDQVGNDILWVGEFREKSHLAKDNYILGYLMNSSESIINTDPMYRFSFPGANGIFNVQGVTVLNASDSSYSLLLSTSFGDNPSYIYRVNYAFDPGTTYKYKYISNKKIMEAPAGGEALFATSSKVWTLSESGTTHFQHRIKSAWNTNFPFVYLLDRNKILNLP